MGFVLLDQIPIRIPTVHTPQPPHGAGAIDHFPAFEHLRRHFSLYISCTTITWTTGGARQVGGDFLLTSTPAACQEDNTFSIGCSVMKHRSPLPGWTFWALGSN